MKSIQSNVYSKESTTEQQIKDIKNSIISEIETTSYNPISYTANDGINENNRYTIGINIDFSIGSEEADNLYEYLKQKYLDNSDNLEYARIRIYSNENLDSLPNLGEIWEM